MLSPKRNKTDANVARGMPEITRTGRDDLISIYAKSAYYYEVRARLIRRRRLVQQRVASKNMIRWLMLATRPVRRRSRM